MVGSMAISEAARNDLYTGLAEVLGSDRAEILMSAIPLHDLDEVATKSDVLLLRTELGAEIGSLRTELGAEIGSLRTELHSEIGSLRAELGAEIGSLRTELHSEIGSLRTELGGEIGSLRGELGGEIGSVQVELRPLSEAVKKLDQKLDRLIFILIAGLFAVIATLIGVGLVG